MSSATPFRSRRVYAPTRRLSRTVRSPSVPRPSGTWAIPIRAILSGLMPRMSVPSKRIRPVAGTMPLIARSVVVLPAPLAPRIPAASLTPRWKETPCSTGANPYEAVTSSSSSRLIVGHLLPQVCLDDTRIGLRLARRALHERPSMVKHHDAIGHSGDQPHMVLDDQDREVEIAAHGTLSLIHI